MPRTRPEVRPSRCLATNADRATNDMATGAMIKMAGENQAGLGTMFANVALVVCHANN